MRSGNRTVRQGQSILGKWERKNERENYYYSSCPGVYGYLVGVLGAGCFGLLDILLDFHFETLEGKEKMKNVWEDKELRDTVWGVTVLCDRFNRLWCDEKRQVGKLFDSVEIEYFCDVLKTVEKILRSGLVRQK